MIFEVTAERDGKFWLVRIPELDGVTQARTRDEIAEMARGYIAVTLALPVDAFEILVDHWRSEPLPGGVDKIVDYLAQKARGYNNHLKWNEQEMLKADLMNAPARWAAVEPERLRARALNAGMRPEDADIVADLLRRRKAGKRLVPRSTYRDFKFGFEPSR